jgi:beta-lactamase class A
VRFRSFAIILNLAVFPAVMLRAQAVAQGPLEQLRAAIEQVTKSVDTNWGIYIKCLDTNEEIALNADAVMDTMSVIKIPLMVEAFREIEAGQLSLSERVPLRAVDKRPGTGVLRSLDDGASLTVKDLLTLMIIVSDNTATDLMFAKVGGPESVNRLMNTYGLTTIRATGTADVWFKARDSYPSRAEFHNDGKTPYGLSSPRDMGRLLEMLARGQAVSKTASAQMVQIMGGQIYATRIPKYVDGFQISHKTGDNVPYIANDVGLLVSPKHTIVLSIFTDKRDVTPNLPTKIIGAQIEDGIARIAQQVANYFTYR